MSSADADVKESSVVAEGADGVDAVAADPVMAGLVAAGGTALGSVVYAVAGCAAR